MKIEISDKWVITSDPDQFIVNSRIISQGEKTKGQEILKPEAYLNTLAQCFKWLMRRHVRECEATSFQEVLVAIRSFEERIDAVIKV